ncbi:hypothetical protein [Bacteroides sp.]|uniref:hypothetical protein n=1 Tax=Bacteroides sp. TaxID=29523 RepID=UPI0025C237DD|nr:hypothetical protein [Bacteroides sp.]
MLLLELLSRTRFQVLTYEPGTNYELPSGVGSGFMISYKDKQFFVTADHVMHCDDYGKIQERQWKDYDLAILNNVINLDKNNVPKSMITPLTGFFYFEKADIRYPQKGIKPFDVTFMIMSEEQKAYPYKTCSIPLADGNMLPADSDKIVIPSTTFVSAKTDQTYSVLGRIKFSMKKVNADNTLLNSEFTLKEGLRFLRKEGDFYILQTDSIVIYEEWAGLSGSPVLDVEGGLLGIACSVVPGGNEIYVLDIHKLLPLMDVAILQTTNGIPEKTE